MKRAFALVLAVASIATAGSVVDITLSQANPGTNAATDTVTIGLDNNGGTNIEIRLEQVDFSDSDPALGAGANGFEWNFSSLVGNFLYAQFDAGAVKSAVYTSLTPVPGFILNLPAGGHLDIATVTVVNPDPGQPGPGVTAYTLDVANADAPDNNTGARIDFDFANPTTLWAGDGSLGGGVGQVTFAVPEPTGLALLALGAVAALRRRA